MNLELLEKLRGEYDVIPVVRRLSADTITPVAAFSAVSGLSWEAFLLESVERGENVGRYSFIGVSPRRRIEFLSDGSIIHSGERAPLPETPNLGERAPSPAPLAVPAGSTPQAPIDLLRRELTVHDETPNLGERAPSPAPLAVPAGSNPQAPIALLRRKLTVHDETPNLGERAPSPAPLAVPAGSNPQAPIDLLRRELTPLRVYDEQSLPPFFGGAVGFFGYGAARWSERLPDRHESDGLPDATLLFFDQVIAFDHVRQELIVVANIFARDPHTSAQLLRQSEERLDAIVAALRGATVDLMEQEPSVPLEFEPDMKRTEFVDMVARAREQIAAGEIFQVVVSQRWSCPYPTGEALRLYRALRSVNPSPYMFLLRTEECTLVGASPEMLVRLHGDVAQTRPIAGTRPRGRSPEEDLRLEHELLADEKENAEHLMLVDLGRNDVGRVSQSGSVEVSEFRSIERYSHVMHIVSNVRGKLRPECRAIDLFLAAFPAGTVSGAPKIRAMELIDELEPQRRGPYAGAVAYFGFSGSLDSCISIRTIVLHGDRAFIQAGAGIVLDSDPGREFEETVNKSAALRRAVERASAGLQKEARPLARGRSHDLQPVGSPQLRSRPA